MRIGLDFDNTIIRYDGVFLAAAKERALLQPDFSGTKQAVRDAIRLLEGGELAWQRLQGHVYGRGISGASMFPGVERFLGRARRKGDTVVIVSHKTEYGHFDPQRVSLREAALDWMQAQGIFRNDGRDSLVAQVYFEGTRAEKLRRIAELECDIFVDDLEEVLCDPGFPAGVKRVLFSEREPGEEKLPYVICPDWACIESVVFDDRR